MRSIETNRGKLISQTKINPRENTCVMTFRSGKEVQTILPAEMPDSAAIVVHTTQPATTPVTPRSTSTENSKLETEPTILDVPRTKLSNKPSFPITKNLVAPLFPGKLAKAKKKVRIRYF